VAWGADLPPALLVQRLRQRPLPRVSPGEARGLTEQRKFGIPCLACRQRIKPFTQRLPVKARAKVLQPDGKSYSHESLKLVGWVHAGCSQAVQS
jgi:hypothetical protein